ncbi:MAG TPA: hypothetical protein PKL83_02510 [bacterium]|nr:hypothetical protein [bacterium]
MTDNPVDRELRQACIDAWVQKQEVETALRSEYGQRLGQYLIDLAWERTQAQLRAIDIRRLQQLPESQQIQVCNTFAAEVEKLKEEITTTGINITYNEWDENLDRFRRQLTSSNRDSQAWHDAIKKYADSWHASVDLMLLREGTQISDLCITDRTSLTAMRVAVSMHAIDQLQQTIQKRERLPRQYNLYSIEQFEKITDKTLQAMAVQRIEAARTLELTQEEHRPTIR